MPESPLCFKDHTAEELEAALAGCVDGRLVRRLQAVIVKQGAAAVPTRLQDARAADLARVALRTCVPALTWIDEVTSPVDGFTKVLFRGDGPEPFEAVRIPLLHRPGHEKYIVCVSSQVGCAMGCAFCETGRLGLTRNLETWEMVDQVLAIRGRSPWPVGGVVFMGMGEPLMNLDRVLRATRILYEPCGAALPAKGITISTSGVVPGIRRLAREGGEVRLIVSLVAARDDLRRKLLPVAAKWPLDELMDAIREYHALTRRRVNLAWVMLAGVNTSDDDAKQLAEVTRGLPILVNLIAVNDPTGRYRPPEREELDRFIAALRTHVRQPIVCRYSGGADIGGACGMLAGRARGEEP